MNSKLKIALAQIAPVWLNREQTITKIIDYISQAAAGDADLVVFGESLLPGYPFYLALTGGAVFNSPVQKELHAHYLSNAVCIEQGDLEGICQQARKGNIAVYLGIIERPLDRGGHSVYASLVYIDASGEIKSVHRKLMPTYEERLAWSPGDGNGLMVHKLGEFTVGGLNCWENWMPLPRAALYAQGEDLHVAVWPGGLHNTEDITRFIAKESRSYVVSVSGYMTRDDFPENTPHLEKILENSKDVLANGGSSLAAPDGTWVIEPVINQETLLFAEIDHKTVLEERQNFDPAGHYSRPDVTELRVNRKRQSTIVIED